LTLAVAAGTREAVMLGRALILPPVPKAAGLSLQLPLHSPREQVAGRTNPNYKSNEEWLRELGLFSLEKRRL